MKKRKGKGLVNKLIDKLPVELHLPGYSFCGPGTKLSKRINQSGINKLDQACKQHDLAYDNPSLDRSIADRKLEESAWERVKSKDANLKERAAAWFVTTAMKAKRKMGSGLKKNRSKKRKQIGFRKIINMARKALKEVPKDDIKLMAKHALLAARKEIKGKLVKPRPRIIKVPPISGGFLPAAIPVLAALSSLGSIVGGISTISKAISQFRNVNNSKNTTPITGGKGLFIKPYKKGFGIITKN